MLNIVRFDCFEVDLASGLLLKRGTRIKLREKSFQVLVALLEHPGQLVTRQELRRRLWQDEVFVDFENNLNTAVARLREALGDSGGQARFIETLPKHGYRFIAEASEIPVRAAGSDAGRFRLVVLPFINLTGDPALEYLCDAIADELITALASVAPDRLAVIARTTSMNYKGGNQDLSRIGRELAVDYAVEGAFRGADGTEMNVQLIRTSDETHVFAKKYKSGWHDPFGLWWSVAGDIRERLGIGGEPRETGAAAVDIPSSRPPSCDPVAYREYIQGRSVFLGKPEDLAEARRHFERAIARDPEFAHAHDALAENYWYLGYLGLVEPRKAFARGILHAVRALELDNTRGETHALLGQFHKTVEYDWGDVHREMALARRLAPKSPLVRTRYAVSELMPLGLLDEAIAELDAALELDPLSSLARIWLGLVLLLSRCYGRAIEESRKLLELDPHSAMANFTIGLCCFYQNQCEEAIASLRKAGELMGGNPLVLGWLGMVLASSGRVAEARDLLRRLLARCEQGYVAPAAIAWIYIGLHELDAAFEWLNRAVEECDQLIMPIKNYGFLDPIRPDPRFLALLRKMNLESPRLP